MWGGHVASAEREPITGVWGGAPRGSRGRAPGQGVMGAKPSEADFFSFWMPKVSSKVASFSVFFKLSKPPVFVIHLPKNLRTEATGESSSKPDRPLALPQ